MRAFLIFLLWLLLGWFFYSMKNSCCSLPSTSAKSASILPGDKTTSIVSSTDTSQVLTEGDVQEPSSTTQAGTEKANITETAEEAKPYNYENSKSIKTKDNLSLIPANGESTLDDELKALLENTCHQLRNNLSKVSIISYAEGQHRKMKKMEDFLIRCGLSPGRVNFKTSYQENEDYDDRIVFKIVK